MREYAVSFFGHRRIDNASAVEKQLETIVCDLLTCQGYITFFVGRDGDFDLLAASVIHRCQRQIRSNNSALVWVMPYVTADYRANETAYQSYYHEIEVSSAAQQVHFKRAYQARNQEMVDRSDLCLFCIQHDHGGAWKTMKYAQQIGVPYILLER